MFQYPGVHIPPNVTVKKVFIYSIFAGGLAAFVNSGLYFILKTWFHIPFIVTVPFSGATHAIVTVEQVMLASFIPAFIAGLVLWLVAKFTKFPVRSFLIFSVAAFFISLYIPFSLHVAAGTKIALSLMHFFAAACIVSVLSTIK